ncbi:hypothetical protein EYR40_001655 [Pleurotus pulmonarius]|nr:hypothetical protein EYR40_001655 [Pleurotus pulmonarius]
MDNVPHPAEPRATLVSLVDPAVSAGDDPDSNSEVGEQWKFRSTQQDGRKNVALVIPYAKAQLSSSHSKQGEITEYAPQEVDTTLPGWCQFGED